VRPMSDRAVLASGGCRRGLRRKDPGLALLALPPTFHTGPCGANPSRYLALFTRRPASQQLLHREILGRQGLRSLLSLAAGSPYGAVQEAALQVLAALAQCDAQGAPLTRAAVASSVHALQRSHLAADHNGTPSFENARRKRAD
jgi:hypothetical protein